MLLPTTDGFAVGIFVIALVGDPVGIFDGVGVGCVDGIRDGLAKG